MLKSTLFLGLSTLLLAPSSGAAPVPALKTSPLQGVLGGVNIGITHGYGLAHDVRNNVNDLTRDRDDDRKKFAEQANSLFMAKQQW